MQSTRWFWAATAGAAVTLVACTASFRQFSNEAILPEIDLVAIKEKSNEALRIAREAHLEVEMANTRLTETDNRLALLSEEVASVSVAKIEELEMQITTLVKALKELQEQIEALKVQLDAPAPAKKQVRSTAVPRSSPAPFPSATFSVLAPEYGQYRLAIQTFNARNYEEAATLFQKIVDQYPQGKYADDCRYWIAECTYAQGKYPEAIVLYQKILDNKGTTVKVDDAIYKMGKSYLALGQTGKAKELWNMLLVEYPSSKYVARVKQHLTEVK